MKQYRSSPIAAFFDFDETLLAIDSAGIGFKVLKEQGYLTWAFMLKMMVIMLLRKVGVVDEQIMARTFLSFYRGRDLQPFVDSAQAFYEEYLQPNLSPEVLQKLRWHQEQGHQTVLVTGSIDYYLQPVMVDLGIDHLLCTHLELDADGLLSGRSKGPVCVGETKVTLAKDLAKSQGLDLTQSYAYGNSELDIPMLMEVGHPVIVNPTSGLVRHAQRYNWPSLV
ncbi:MAG: HAD-IB family hydrolase [Candidatus Marinimicrobia bacterium]|nr:HAD-IB family hydrolase [Candidatus Neomarinimicrobiota bacterium]MCF7922189.1 HAD-IB family hydrolase [Candidatus Neomarinimicrobiota bacterium]